MIYPEICQLTEICSLNGGHFENMLIRKSTTRSTTPQPAEFINIDPYKLKLVKNGFLCELTCPDFAWLWFSSRILFYFDPFQNVVFSFYSKKFIETQKFYLSEMYPWSILFKIRNKIFVSQWTFWWISPLNLPKTVILAKKCYPRVLNGPQNALID